jgi:hypothetical protein
MVVAVYNDPITGIACVLIPNPAEQMPGETAQAFAKRIADKDVPAGVVYKLVPASTLPASRRFRNAWKHDGTGNIVHDMTAARAIRKAEILGSVSPVTGQQIQGHRDHQLAAVRAKVAAALEDGDAATAATLQARARVLRGLEATIDAQLAGVADVLALATWVPTELQGSV